jgi:hypothetical protein
MVIGVSHYTVPVRVRIVRVYPSPGRHYKNIYLSSRKHPLRLPNFHETWIFKTNFRKIFNYKFHKNFSEGAELLRADRRTDMTKLIVAFRNLRKHLITGWQCIINCGWPGSKRLWSKWCNFPEFPWREWWRQKTPQGFDMPAGIQTGHLSTTSVKVWTNLHSTVQELTS